MADFEFGTPDFNQFWRVNGFFGTVEHRVTIASGNPTIGPVDHIMHIGSPLSLTATNALVIQGDLAEMRDELTRIRAALDRIATDIQPGLSGGGITQHNLETNLISLGGWMASALQTVGAMSYYLSESGFTKVRGFLKPQMTAFDSHPSQKPDSGVQRKPRIRRRLL